jgi:glutathione S-transferase
MSGQIVLHEYADSGNCYKIRLTLAHLGIAYARRQYDILKGETRTPDFLATVNANGRIPVLQVGERLLPESNAAIWYLAEDSPLLPDDRWGRAEVLRWMFFEQYNHEPNVATMRFWKAFVGEANWTDMQRLLAPVKMQAGEAALQLMDEHLDGRGFFVGDALSIADIALYAYTHVAADGGFDLKAWPNVMAWCEAVRLQPGHVEIGA